VYNHHHRQVQQVLELAEKALAALEMVAQVSLVLALVAQALAEQAWAVPELVARVSVVLALVATALVELLSVVLLSVAPV